MTWESQYSLRPALLHAASPQIHVLCTVESASRVTEIVPSELRSTAGRGMVFVRRLTTLGYGLLGKVPSMMGQDYPTERHIPALILRYGCPSNLILLEALG